MKTIAIVLATACLATAAFAADLTPTQQRMIDCNTKAHGMTGDDRKNFMTDCLKRGSAPTQPSPPVPVVASPKPHKAPLGQSTGAPLGPSEWSYSSMTDPMTSKEIRLAKIESGNTISLGFPYQGIQSVTLTLRSAGGRSGAAAMLTIAKGQFQCNVYSCPVMLRVDDKPAVTLTGAEAADHDSTVLFLPYARILRMLTGAKTLAIAPTFFQNGSPVLDFNVANFDPQKMQSHGK